MGRMRCLVKGCNPKLYGESEAAKHKAKTGHRTAKWPVRSPERIAKDAERYKLTPEKIAAMPSRRKRREARKALSAQQNLEKFRQENKAYIEAGLCKCDPDECCKKCCIGEWWCCNDDGTPMYDSFEDGYGEGF